MPTRIHSTPNNARILARASVRGTAILPALIVVVMVATLSMVYVQMALSKNKEQRVSVDSKRAFYMAEAGLAEGFNGLCMGKSGNVASEAVPAQFGGGLFWTTATELGSGRVKLESTGLCGAGRATLALTCERRSDNVGSLGFFGSQNITVEEGALIDSYDSRLGTYASQAATAELSLPGARVGGNQDITLQGSFLKPTVIYGDVSPGPLGTLFRPASGTKITGSKAPSLATVTFPTVKPPVLPAAGNLLVSTNRSLPSGAYGLNNLYVNMNTTLVLNGPQVIVTDELWLKKGSKLNIDATNGPVKIYVLSDVWIDGGSTITTLSTDPRAVTIQVAGTSGTPTVSINGTAEFHGSIYSPTASIALPAGFHVYGSVVANGLTLKTGGKLHFDRAFGAGGGGPGSERLLGWHIVELPNVPIVRLRYDALTDLIRRGVTPRKPNLGHFDLGVDVN